MNRRQIIHWCQGQYAAAYHRGKKGANSRPEPTPGEIIDNCFAISKTLLDSFRIGLFYDTGKFIKMPDRLNIIQSNSQNVFPKPSRPDRLLFVTKPITHANLKGVVEIGLYDHSGKLVTKQKVSASVVAEVIKTRSQIAAQIILKKGKS